MPISYSCFISYPSGQSELLKQFIEQFEHLLKERLDFYVDHPLYYDKRRLGPGYRFNEDIARALCESACMVVIYMPKYEKRVYCLREFKAMEELEKRRLAALNGRLSTSQGMIIPIVLRCAQEPNGKLRLPAWMKDRWQVCDFSKYATETATDHIESNPEFVRAIEDIAVGIANLFLAMESLDEDPCALCSDYKIPSPEDVSERLRAASWDRAGLPLRAGGQ